MAGGQGLAGSGLSVSLIADVEKAVRDITVTADTVINKLNEVKFAAKQAQKSIADSYKQIGQNLGRIGSDIDRTVRGTGKMRRIFTDIGKTGIGRIFDPTE